MISVAVVAVERSVGVEVDDGWRAAVRGREHERIDGDLAFLQVPVRPHAHVVLDVPRRSADVDRVRETQHAPEMLRPGTRGDHELLADPDPALVGLDCGRDVVVAELDAGHLDAREHQDSLAGALLGEPLHRFLVEREAALVLVQADGHPLCAPVREQLPHVRRRRRPRRRSARSGTRCAVAARTPRPSRSPAPAGPSAM